MTIDELIGRALQAQELVLAGDFVRAVDVLVWLWHHGEEHDPEFEVIKHSAVAGCLGAAGDGHPPSRARIVAERDAQLQRLAAGFTLPGLTDLMSLFRAARDDAGAAAWIRASLDTLPRTHSVYCQVRTVLERSGQFAELGRFVDDPLSILEARRDGWTPPGPATSDEEREEQQHYIEAEQQIFREETRTLVRALRAAGRDAEAVAVRERALEHDGSKAMRDALGETIGEA